jgi:hypothetical protein
MGVDAPILRVGLCTDDEEGLRLMKRVQANEVQEAAIHNVKTAGFEGDLVEGVDLVQFAIGDVYKARNVAAQIEQRVQSHCRFGSLKARPRKQRQRQVDRGGVQRVGCVAQFDAEGLVCIELACLRDQTQREVAIDTPVASDVGIGQRALCDAASETDVMKLVRMGLQASLDVAQALAGSELRVGHREELIQMRKLERWIAVRIARHAAAKSMQRQMVDQLSEHKLACVHARASGSKCRKTRRLGFASSSR